jgi:predicted metal-dependent enzyme (double-stranded beta helix superfamily)
MTITQANPSLGADRLVAAAPMGANLHPHASGPLLLLDLLQSYVAETAELLPRAEPGLTERSYELLELTDELEIWAIHWPQGQGLELHDHGGSVGALWVVEGTLEEHYIREEHSVRPEQTLGRRSIVSGGGAAFGPHYVHDVVNAEAAPATSVHAYSPPMASMTFYRQEARGLVVDRAEYRADPSWAP